MSNVTGYIDGIAYTAVIDAEIADADPDAVGIVTGSDNLLALVRAWNGETIIAGPIPASEMVVDAKDERSIVRALMTLTQVHAVSPDAVDINEDEEPIPADAVH